MSQTRSFITICIAWVYTQDFRGYLQVPAMGPYDKQVLSSLVSSTASPLLRKGVWWQHWWRAHLFHNCPMDLWLARSAVLIPFQPKEFLTRIKHPIENVIFHLWYQKQPDWKEWIKQVSRSWQIKNLLHSRFCWLFPVAITKINFTWLLNAKYGEQSHCLRSRIPLLGKWP